MKKKISKCGKRLTGNNEKKRADENVKSIAANQKTTAYKNLEPEKSESANKFFNRRGIKKNTAENEY